MRGHDRPVPLLGRLSPRQFLASHWQKRPLLVRGAFGRVDVLSPGELIALACREEAESRLIVRRGTRWEVQHGPFEPRDFRRLPKRGWTLLVQDVNHYVSGARALLQRFAFVPYARLDDVMVSYAAPGGGVGPHLDSYDVFLLQGLGQRRWRLSRQRDLALVPDAPLRLLAHFRPEREWLLSEGDMLYLPPSYAHDGVAASECMTYSVGFRASTWQELQVAFLSHLQDRTWSPGQYTDPGLAPTSHPASIGAQMVREVQERLDRIRWRRAEVVAFLGNYLTEPKPHIVFARPRQALSLRGFRERAVRSGVRLGLKSAMLYHGHRIFINGESAHIPSRLLDPLRELADTRRLRPSGHEVAELFAHLYEWYRTGYLEIGAEPPG